MTSFHFTRKPGDDEFRREICKQIGHWAAEDATQGSP